VHVEQSMLIQKPAEELYRFWRHLENLPRIMTHLESVTRTDERRSHWVVTTDKLGLRLEWEAEVTADEPNTRIAWRSLPGAQV
ncbi:SRPBCC family protein, partial [Acinetobacter baumannii]